jgi:hypothetical protein
MLTDAASLPSLMCLLWDVLFQPAYLYIFLLRLSHSFKVPLLELDVVATES